MYAFLPRLLVVVARVFVELKVELSSLTNTLHLGNKWSDFISASFHGPQRMIPSEHCGLHLNTQQYPNKMGRLELIKHIHASQRIKPFQCDSSVSPPPL